MKSQKIVIAMLDALDRKAHCGTCLWIAALIVLCLVLPIGAVGQAKYSITDLGTLGGDNSIPFWVTNSGDVIGVSDTGHFDSSGFPIDHAFRWSKGVMQDLGTLGGNHSSATGGNDRGQAAGVADLTGGVTSHAFLSQEGIRTDLGTLVGPGGYSWAQQVNNEGQAVGASEATDGTFHAALWNHGAISDLGTLGGADTSTFSLANGINDLGQIVGDSQLNNIIDPRLTFPPFSPTLWDKGAVTKLSGEPNYAFAGDAFNINNKTQVVGRIAVADPNEGAVAHAYLWENGVMSDLGVSNGDDNSEANSLNDNGQIVGDSGLGFILNYTPDHALLWQNGTRFDLNSLIPSDSGFRLIVAFDVNARGEIVVCAVQLSSGNIHAALLSPQAANVSDNASVSVGEGTRTTAVPSLSPRAQRMLDHARHMKSGRRGAME